MLGGLRRGKAAPHDLKRGDGYYAHLENTGQFNQDVPSWLNSPVTGVVTLVVIGAALAVLTTTLFIKDEEEE